MSKDFEKAVKKYNDIMMELCWEHSTIGTSYSEGTEKWNLRDLVAEADYLLSCYSEPGHCRYEDRLDGEDEYRTWRREKGLLERFIKKWLPMTENMKCTEGHCSQYDNQEKERKYPDIEKAIEKKEDTILVTGGSYEAIKHVFPDDYYYTGTYSYVMGVGMIPDMYAENYSKQGHTVIKVDKWVRRACMAG